MSNPEDARKFYVEQSGPTQGQIIGDYSTVNMHFQGAGPQEPPPEQIWMVPFPRNPFFLGQEDLLTRLHQNLLRGTTTAVTQIQAVNGLGGIGKTQLALEYAYRYRELYPYVFWVRAEHRETLIADFVTIAQLLRLSQQQETEQMKIVQAALRWLTTHVRWLLVFDNADDLTILYDFLPTNPAGSILLTTRLAQTEPQATPLQVRQFDERLGAELLLQRAHLLKPGQILEDARSENQQAAREIAHLVGGLPLALDQAGAYIDETQCTVGEYLKFYQRDRAVRTKLLGKRGKGTSSHADPVATTWKLAFERVERASPAAADLLRACAFLDPDAIPEDLVQQGASYWSKRLAQIAEDPFRWNEALGELLNYSLLRRDREQKTLSIHRLVQTVLRDSLDEKTERQWAEHTVNAVNQAFPDGTKADDWEICRLLLPQGLRCIELINQEKMSSSEILSLLLNTANYLQQTAQYREAELLNQQAMRIIEQSFGKENSNLTYPLNNIANIYSLQGRYKEAESLYKKSLQIRERILGPEHPLIAKPLSNLANLYLEQRKYREAEPLYKKALQIWEKNLGVEHLYVANPINGLAILYTMQERYNEAEPLYKKALQIWEKNLGAGHPDVSYALGGLASLYRNLNKYTEAEPLYKRALQIRKQGLGNKHPLTKEIQENYASLLRMMKRDAEAASVEEEE